MATRYHIHTTASRAVLVSTFIFHTFVSSVPFCEIFEYENSTEGNDGNEGMKEVWTWKLVREWAGTWTEVGRRGGGFSLSV